MRLRLILSFVFIVLLTASLVLLVAVRQTAIEVRNFIFRGGIQGIEQHVAALEQYYRQNNSWRGAAQVLRTPGSGGKMRQWGLRFGPMPSIQPPPLTLADPDGEILAVTGSPGKRQGFLSADELARAIPLEVGGEKVGYLLPENSVNITPKISLVLLNRLNRVAITAGLIAGGIAIVVALLLSQGLLRPIRELTRGATNLAKGDLTHRVEVQGRDELATLGQTFNHMAASLEQAEARRRAMTADIAHELRNPLAVQRAHLEALQDGVYPLSPKNLAPIEEQNRLLTRLVEDLRTLALADAGKIELELTSTDLNKLADRVIARFQPQADTQQVELKLSLDETCPPLVLDSQRIEQILNNLLNNALRHTPEGGWINLKTQSLDETVQVIVHDSGPGIPEEAIAHIFERFFKTERSRSRAEGGTGLGLSIARKLAQAHGGDLTAANHVQGGALFTLSLPTSKDFPDGKK
ncbi:MAG: ATP-binding protein [Anaerolineales bacterium]|jgi:signal transduction histidine kinase